MPLNNLINSKGGNRVNQKTLIGADACLEVTGTEQIDVLSDSKFALSNYSISFFVYKNTATGNTYFNQSTGFSLTDTDFTGINAEQWTHIVLCSDGTLFYNGSPQTSITPKGNLLNANFTIGTGDYLISHFCIFNKVLNAYEVLEHLYLNGGTPKESLHENIVAHYPLAQRQSYEVQSGDVATSKGLSIGDYAVWDVSEQYNYTKAIPITAQHGELVNYPATILDTATNVSFKEFYDTSQDYRPISGGNEIKTALPPLIECLKFGSEGGYVDFDISNPPSSNSSPFTLCVAILDTSRVIPIIGTQGRTYGAFRSSGYTSSNGAFWAIDQYTGAPGATGLAQRNKYIRRTPSIISASNFYDKVYTFGTSYADYATLLLHTVVYNPVTQKIENWINTNKTESNTVTNHNLNTFGYGRFGSGGFVTVVGEAQIEAYEGWHIVSFGYWKRALQGWEIAELCNNQAIYSGNPFAWNTSINTGFQDNLEIWHQFQTGSIYWDGANYRVTNYGSGADATLSNYATGSADFVTDNPNSIVEINSLR